MTKAIPFLAFLFAIAGSVLYFTTDLSLAQLLALGAGALFLLWQIVLLTVPWNLYFAARAVIYAAHESRAAGITVPEGRETEAARIATRLKWAAIGAHVLSAAVVAVITAVSGRQIGYYFSAFYLLSTAFRPAQAYFLHLRARIRGMLHDVQYPREDVQALKDRLAAAEHRADQLDQRIDQLTAADSELRHLVENLDVATTARDNRLDRQVDALGRRFEDTVNRLTDNQEVIAGIKAFLRLVRSDQL
ncbi:hypothetical protein [Yinghuangia seranimata]|uniref:hypothetical protein n=1 Tax=Yinghuangia seranimata TaxID=408067 RepID=UPI00248BEA01|nr:hypothetical protein [Yinghuangia seranimata]MDI2127691.1 hypothetical protein [Yinghuangia seranimata]